MQGQVGRVAGSLALLGALVAACAGGSDRRDGTAPVPDRSRDLSAPMPVSAAQEAPAVPTVVVIDASGSMVTQDAPGQRLEAAKAAVTEVVTLLPWGHEVGLVVYGSGTGSSDAEQVAGCQDVVVAREVAPRGQRDVAGVLAQLQPSGYTPIGLSLQTAADLLPKTGPRQVVVVSDGLDTCAPDGLGVDPCLAAQELHAADPELTVSTIGFRTESDPAAAEQLDCIATAGGGKALGAATSTLLGTRLSAALNSGWSAQALGSTSFRGIALGSTIDEVAAAVDEDLPTIRSRGVVELEIDDATLQLTDGLVTAITVATPDVRTIDGLAVGDSRADAELLYGPARPGPDGDLLVSADAGAATSFRLGVDDDEIVSITLCACG
ncbi:vWA domain-containing protein [Aeromicrobium sp. Sec7.5]|uniref:vWA domain-containing protein n=1 Tax=Aeromicrobium sp. Sec7.5 TaxID=3121276 RepID=UPI002FE4B8F2